MMFRLYGAVLLSKGRRPPERLYPGDSDHLRASVLGSALQRARMNPPQLESGRLCAWIGASPTTVELANTESRPKAARHCYVRRSGSGGENRRAQQRRLVVTAAIAVSVDEIFETGRRLASVTGRLCPPFEFRFATRRVSSSVPPHRPSRPGRRRGAPFPRFVPPQLSQLVERPPSGPQWLHEIKLDGYRMAARIDNGHAQLLTRTRLDWTGKYPGIIAALANLNVKTAYLDGELCGVDGAGLPSFAQTQAATDGERGVHLVYYAFDIVHIAGWDVSKLPLIERKALLEPLVASKPGLQFNGHETGDGELILKHAGKLRFEGVVSKTIDAPYAPRNRGLWRKAKWLNRQEFVIVGWSDPEGTRPHLGALLLGYYTDDGKLIYAGRVGTGMSLRGHKRQAVLRRRNCQAGAPVRRTRRCALASSTQRVTCFL